MKQKATTELDNILAGDQLWELSAAEAHVLLDAFLLMERQEFPKQSIGAIELNYTSSSVVLALVQISEIVKAGLVDQEQQKLWFGRLGYYFGEALCRRKRGLFWRPGNREYAFANHPVIAGFDGDEEAPVITICRNVVQAVALDGAPVSRIETTVRRWFEKSVVGQEPFGE